MCLSELQEVSYHPSSKLIQMQFYSHFLCDLTKFYNYVKINTSSALRQHHLDDKFNLCNPREVIKKKQKQPSSPALSVSLHSQGRAEQQAGGTCCWSSSWGKDRRCLCKQYLSLLHLGADQTPLLLQQRYALLRLGAGARVVAVQQHQSPLGQQLAVHILLRFQLAVQLLQARQHRSVRQSRSSERGCSSLQLKVMRKLSSGQAAQRQQRATLSRGWCLKHCDACPGIKCKFICKRAEKLSSPFPSDT